MKRVLVFTFLAGAWQGLVIAQSSVEPIEAAMYRRALYPDGPPLRVNPQSGKSEQTEFSVHARVTLPPQLPDSARQVVVYSGHLHQVTGPRVDPSDRRAAANPLTSA